MVDDKARLRMETELAKLREEHITVAGFPVDGDLVAIRKPSHGEYTRFIDRMGAKNSSNSMAMKELALACLIFPAVHEQKRELLDKWPGLITQLANRAVELAGSDIAELGNG